MPSASATQLRKYHELYITKDIHHSYRHDQDQLAVLLRGYARYESLPWMSWYSIVSSKPLWSEHTVEMVNKAWNATAV